MSIYPSRTRILHCLAASVMMAGPPACAAGQSQPPAAQSKPAETEKNAAQIELLETKYRFESNGDSRKEVHTRVKINNELGVRQFGRLNFDFNRGFQSVEIPLVRIAHPGGGITDILPSATTDNPHPAVADAPAYQDVRVKSVRILGLQPGDLLEYRVVTSTTHHPLAPDFWLEHAFDHAGVVSNELFEVSLPSSRKIQMYSSPTTPFTSFDQATNGPEAVRIYRWKHTADKSTEKAAESTTSEPEVVVTTFASWPDLALRIASRFAIAAASPAAVREKALALVQAADAESLTSYRPGKNIAALYDFVSQKIRTVDLPLGSTGFKTNPPGDVLSCGYATPEDKFVLFAALAREVATLPQAGLVATAMPKESAGLARPAIFDHLLTETGVPSVDWWLDLNLEVAPYRVIPSQFRGKRALIIGPAGENYWRLVPSELPLDSQQKVSVDAALLPDGTLKAKIKYALRGDNELLLRVAFHKTPKDKWTDLAQLLAISDGFRGQISNVTASDPYATQEAFSVAYEISQPKFVDWSKKPVRIPALLPSPGLPEIPSAAAHSAGGGEQRSIDLGPPLQITLDATVTLPEGTAVQMPTGTAVERDYATFSSKYSAQANTIHASRKLRFLSAEVPAARAGDLNAFLHAVQSDQSQLFSLQLPAQK